jgi:hypothetical protein
MDSEIADTFFHRLQLAQHIKQVANAQRRLHAFVGSISSDSFAVLQSKVVEGVIRRLMRSNERLVTSFQRAVEVILAEVNDNFNYAMRSAVLLYRHLDATEVCNLLFFFMFEPHPVSANTHLVSIPPHLTGLVCVCVCVCVYV